MKLLIRILLAAAVLSGTVSLSIHSENGKVTVQAEAAHPEQMTALAGRYISAAGSICIRLVQASGQPSGSES